MITNREMQDALADLHVLAVELVDQINLMPGQLDGEAQVSEEARDPYTLHCHHLRFWTRQFVKAVARAMALVTEATVT